jgi:hypothetical protein
VLGTGFFISAARTPLQGTSDAGEKSSA